MRIRSYEIENYTDRSKFGTGIHTYWAKRTSLPKTSLCFVEQFCPSLVFTCPHLLGRSGTPYNGNLRSGKIAPRETNFRI